MKGIYLVGEEGIGVVIGSRLVLTGLEGKSSYPVGKYTGKLVERGSGWSLLECDGALEEAVRLDGRHKAGLSCTVWGREGNSIIQIPGWVEAITEMDPAMPKLAVQVQGGVASRLEHGLVEVDGAIIGILTKDTWGVPGGSMLSVRGLSVRWVLARSRRLRDIPATETLVSSMPEQWPRKPLPMVGWFDPDQLFETASRVIISSVFGQFDDFRSEQKGLPPTYEQALTPTDGGQKELWIDYLADTGEGFDSTFTVASAVSLPELPLKRASGEWEITRRGHLLVLGGDQVYPAASSEEYRERLVRPFRLASQGECTDHPWIRRRDGKPNERFRPGEDFVGTDDAVRPDSPLPPPLPWVVAVPGNHDWYDNLIGFMQIFAVGERFASWNPVQERSYFCLRLPWGWWLMGVDLQLTGDIDPAQLDYFLSRVNTLAPGDKVILCGGEPWWVLDRLHPVPRPYLKQLESLLSSRGNLKLWISGDQHHYRRHSSDHGLHKLTAGGGGAFLHPTHPEGPFRNLDGFKLKKAFPDAWTSRRLGLWTLAFPFLNPRFSALVGTVYLIGAWQLVPLVGASRNQPTTLLLPDPVEILDMFSLMLETALVNPASGISLMVIIAGFRLFSNTPSKHYNNIAGFLHGVAHVLGLFLIYWGATRWTVWGLGLEPRSTEQLLLSVPLIFLGGAMVGSLLMACYLAISYNLFGHHQNEAFSALRLKDWKNFLRLKLTPDSVTIYPVGFPRVARAWEPNPSAGGPARWPEDPEGCRPILIEEPVVMSFK